jgi:hypothetical protein
MTSWAVRGHRERFDPGKDLIKFITNGSVNLVVEWAPIYKTMLLPGTSRYSGDLLKFNFRDETPPKLYRRTYIALHYAGRISWNSHSDESELVRVGPSGESGY